ncbi:hypothetical protein IJF86_01015 [Candidatus Saccharibacteria bacterium]|nr:hypothetical protein [Candidatus Saccharibacteria bacterium]
MGIMVSKTDENTKLTERVNADLRAKLDSTSAQEDKDFTESSEYLKEMEKTGKFSWVWAVLIILAIISLIFIILI